MGQELTLNFTELLSKMFYKFDVGSIMEGLLFLGRVTLQEPTTRASASHHSCPGEPSACLRSC